MNGVKNISRAVAKRRDRLPLAIAGLARTATLWAALAAVAIGSAGCAAVSSVTPLSQVQSGSAPNGVWYTLPRSIVDLRLTVIPGAAKFGLEVGNPRSIADPTHRYLLQYRPLPHYNDTIDIDVSPRGMLKKVTSRTKDETKQIILNIAKAFGAIGGGFEAGAAGGASTLHTLTIDPTDEDEVRNAVTLLNRTLKKFAESRSNPTGGCDPKQGQPRYFDPATRELCLAYQRLATRKRPVLDLKFIAANSIEGGEIHAVSLVGGPPADCSGGICYRPPVPYFYKAAIDGVATTGLMMLPNRSPVVVIDVRRGFFIEKIQNMQFDDDGFLQQFDVDKPSEIEALSLLPVEIIGAISEGLQLRIKVTQAQITAEKTERMLVEQQAAIERQRAQYDEAERLARANQGAVATPNTTPSPSLQAATAAPAAAAGSVLAGEQPTF